MEDAGAVVVREHRLHAAAPHTDVDPATTRVSFPRDWPDRDEPAQESGIHDDSTGHDAPPDHDDSIDHGSTDQHHSTDPRRPRPLETS